MPAELRDPTDPREWLRRARSNLALARIGRQADILFDDLSFEAQQAAEKAVKAVLVWRSLRFPKTQVISDLLTLAAAGGVSIPEDVRKAEALTPYAVGGRYPGWGEDVSAAELDMRWLWRSVSWTGRRTSSSATRERKKEANRPTSMAR